MEMDEDYDNADPFENGLLFCVSEDIPALDAEVFFRMEGESGLVEIKDRETDEVLWSRMWEENVDGHTFTISLDHLQKEKDYSVRFTGTKIIYADVKITFDSELVQEKERPSK